MKNTFLIVTTMLAIAFTSCNSKNNQEDLNGVHKVVVKEVLQATEYTYLNVTEEGKEQWIAARKLEAKEGEAYYFKDFMEMTQFESKDLERVFESVYFVSELTASIEDFKAMPKMEMPEGHVGAENHEGKPSIQKESVEIEAAEGGITIAQLFENRDKYNGEKVIIRGKVVKTNFAIMNKNWFHIQDGTSFEGKFDLTLTSIEEEVKENDIVTFEGTVVLDKDFGYGYKYEILIEDAVKK
ncbi:MAG: hypothetical protein C0597_04210 [Marinilabiliales bacterium]|nr:MAG: hypothetical protein C0597_04210 [Marinilabiliales bacterium]